MRPPHVGSMLRDIIEGIQAETGRALTIGEIAEGLGTSRKTVSLILNEKQGISSDMAIKLSEGFGSTPEFWLKLQYDYELWHANQRVNRTLIKHFLIPPQGPIKTS